MKQTAILLVLGTVVTFFTYCGGSKKAQVAPPVKLTYDDNLKPIITATCSPCHTPGNGKFPSYLVYDNTKRDIDDIVHRISLQPGEKGFMPMKHPRLSDSTINKFVQWKADGLLEK